MVQNAKMQNTLTITCGLIYAGQDLSDYVNTLCKTNGSSVCTDDVLVSE
jgi:hypothetical protein